MKRIACVMFIIFAIQYSDFSIGLSQNRSEFVVADSGKAPYIRIDDSGRVHIVWSFYGCRNAILYSLGNPLKPIIKVVNIPGEGLGIRYPRLATSDKNNLIVWEDDTPTMFYNTYILGQLVSYQGEKVGDTLFMNYMPYFDAYRRAPDICSIDDSTFFVVWHGSGPQTPVSSGIYGQVITNSGRRIGGNLLIDGSDFEDWLARCASNLSTSSNIIIVWIGAYSNKYRAVGRVFSKQRTPIGTSFTISDTTDPFESWSSAVVVNSSGDFWVAWSEGDPQGPWEIRLRKFNVNGQPVGQIQKVSKGELYSTTEISIAIGKDDRFVVTWEGMQKKLIKIFGQRFNSNGTPIGDNFPLGDTSNQITQYRPAVSVHDGKIYTVWGDGAKAFGNIFMSILDFDNPVVGVEAKIRHTSTPDTYSIAQNYPDPFNPSTTIEYTLPLRSRIRLHVFNILGQQVATLYDGEQLAGYQKVQWNAHVASGIYFYRIEAAAVDNPIFHFIGTKKMLLLK